MKNSEALSQGESPRERTAAMALELQLSTLQPLDAPDGYPATLRRLDTVTPAARKLELLDAASKGLLSEKPEIRAASLKLCMRTVGQSPELSLPWIQELILSLAGRPEGKPKGKEDVILRILLSRDQSLQGRGLDWLTLNPQFFDDGERIRRFANQLALKRPGNVRLLELARNLNQDKSQKLELLRKSIDWKRSALFATLARPELNAPTSSDPEITAVIEQGLQRFLSDRDPASVGRAAELALLRPAEYPPAELAASLREKAAAFTAGLSGEQAPAVMVRTLLNGLAITQTERSTDAFVEELLRSAKPGFARAVIEGIFQSQIDPAWYAPGSPGLARLAATAAGLPLADKTALTRSLLSTDFGKNAPLSVSVRPILESVLNSLTLAERAELTRRLAAETARLSTYPVAEQAAVRELFSPAATAPGYAKGAAGTASPPAGDADPICEHPLLRFRRALQDEAPLAGPAP